MSDEDDSVFRVGSADVIYPTTANMILGETMGSAILAFIAIGIGVAGNLFNSPTDWRFAWGMGIAMACYVAGSLSGAHFNPSVTFAMAAIGRHPWSKVPLYLICQLVGWIIGTGIIGVMAKGALDAYVKKKGLSISDPAIGSWFTTFAPNPGTVGTPGFEQYSFALGFFAELAGTALLILFILTTDASPANKPPAWAGPLVIGFAVVLLASFFGPYSQASFNAMRDLGPRIVWAMLGAGGAAFPTTGIYAYGWISTTIAPIIGGVAAALVFDRFDKKVRVKVPVTA